MSKRSADIEININPAKKLNVTVQQERAKKALTNLYSHGGLDAFNEGTAKAAKEAAEKKSKQNPEGRDIQMELYLAEAKAEFAITRKKTHSCNLCTSTGCVNICCRNRQYSEQKINEMGRPMEGGDPEPDFPTQLDEAVKNIHTLTEDIQSFLGHIVNELRDMRRENRIFYRMEDQGLDEIEPNIEVSFDSDDSSYDEPNDDDEPPA